MLQLTNKQRIIISAVLVVLIVLVVMALLGVFKGSSPQSDSMADLSPSPSGSVTPTLNVQTYDSLIQEYDGRRLLLAADCSSSTPSGVDYKNGTKIMIDNSASDQPRTIIIGSNSYSIPAHGWRLVTLYSRTLPVNLPMYCSNIELGQIGIIK